jgi:ADP-ribosylglycohydrolase
MLNEKLSRARGCMAGLAIGDALGRPVEGMSSQEIREKYGDVENFLSQTPGGSDDTEYAILTAIALLKNGRTVTADQIADLWREKVCYQSENFLGAGFSEMAAIANLKAGLVPPQSGIHMHSWSDGLAMRVAPIGIVGAGDFELTKKIAIADGQVSHAGEGIHSGVAVAVAISAAMNGATAQESFLAAKKSIPEDSWSYRSIKKVEQILLANKTDDIHELTDELVSAVATHEYHYADLAPEAASLALAAVHYGDGDFIKTVRFAVNMGRDADTIAAMAGAVAGAMVGYEAIPEHWRNSVQTVQGTCLAFTKGLNPVALAEELVLL